jgi:hypothetical protein
MSAFGEMCKKRNPVHKSSPAFIIHQNKKLKSVSYSMLPTFLKKVIVDNVLDPNNYKSQSWTFKNEVSPDIIQLPNEEKSNACELKKGLGTPKG